MQRATSESSPFVAGLDGLRAIAVLAVLAFHSRFGAASGGFLGVSLFFTLSGYLITQLLIRESALGGGRIDVRAFWMRRFRRLMPGAIVVIVAVALASIFFDRFPSPHLRGDLFSALGYVANWRFMAGSTSYADLFTSVPSPVLHFWSLAIEEQFYVVYPVLIAVLSARRRKWIVPGTLGMLFAASVTANVLGGSHNTVYYGTQTRAAEILAGALLGLWFPLGGLPAGDPGPMRRWLGSPVVNGLVFATALSGFVYLVVTVDTGDSWLYAGGLSAISVLSVILIIGVQSPGPVRWIAERSVLVRIGGLSYGLYLYHWPIFLLVTRSSTSLSGWSLHALRYAITVVLAWLSSIVIEQPIRRRTVLRSPVATVCAVLVALGVSVVSIALVPRTAGPTLAGLDAPEGFVEFGAEHASAPLGVLVIGSEPTVVQRLRTALGDRFDLTLVDETKISCPLRAAPGCDPLSARIDRGRRAHPPDIIVVAFGDVDRRMVAVDTSELPLDDPAFFQATRTYVADVVDAVDAVARIPALFIDLGRPDAMRATIEDAGLRSANVVSLVDPTAVDIGREVDTIRSTAAGTDERARVMVIGDSTSYGISVAIDQLAGERINVLWAGGQNCPLVDVEAVKWWEGVEFDVRRCPSLEPQWRAALDSFRPSVVVVADSVPEQAEQRYPGDPAWHLPGSDEYQRVHDEFVTAFMAEMVGRGIAVVVLDSPPIHGGALGGAPFAGAERIASWNAVITRWAQAWPQVTVVQWAEALAAFEPTPGALRVDGVHLRQQDLNDLVARALLPVVRTRLVQSPG